MSETGEEFLRDESEIDLGELLEDMEKGLRRFAPLLLLLFLIVASGLYVALKLKYIEQYEASITYTIVKTEDQTIDANIAKWLSSSFSSVMDSGLQMKLKKTLKVTDSSELPGMIEVKNTDGAAMLTFTVKADTKAAADSLLQAFTESYPDYAAKSVGTLELLVLDQRTADDMPVQALSPFKRSAASILAGIAACVGILVVYALTRKTIRRQSDMEQITNIPCAASLPSVRQKKRKHKAESHMLLVNRRLDWKYKQEILALQAKIERNMGKMEHKSLLVTSSIAGEGKSTIAVNLALGLSEKYDVLLIDGDFRHSGIKSLFDLKRKPGLAEYISEKASWRKIQHKVKENLRVIHSGELKGSLSSILTDEKYKKLKENIQKETGYVIFDVMPAALSSEAALLSELAEHGLYVIMQDAVPAGLVREGIEQISRSTEFLLGYVFNHFKTGVINYDGYGYGSAGYYGNYETYQNHEWEKIAVSRQTARIKKIRKRSSELSQPARKVRSQDNHEEKAEEMD